MRMTFLGAAREVTGSSHLVEVGGRRVLLDCGLVQGGHDEDERNRAPFPFDPASLDAVVLSHAHIDHSGRLPLLIARGYKGPVYTQHASADLARIMLRDSAFLQEKEAEWDNRKRARKGLDPVTPLYTMREARRALQRFRGIDYEAPVEIVPGVTLTLRDAGHILGSSIVELHLRERGAARTLVFSGDLGHAGAPILHSPTRVREADVVVMEGTYGERLHRSREETLRELHEILREARADHGNVLIPAFAVGRSQDLLYLFARHFREWDMDAWSVFLDSPLAIEATEIYARHRELYDAEARHLWAHRAADALVPNLHLTRTTLQSMRLNRLRSGAIIMAGSGMCTGGRIKHHLKNNVWREECHVVIVGFQARGTLGRALVDGAHQITLWGETMRVAAHVHTIGGLSAHADQQGLLDWHAGFEGRPRTCLVHGEPEALDVLQSKLVARQADVRIPSHGDAIHL